MLSEADRAVLDESFQNTRMAGEAIHMVIGKVEDEDLALDLNRQKYKRHDRIDEDGQGKPDCRTGILRDRKRNRRL